MPTTNASELDNLAANQYSIRAVDRVCDILDVLASDRSPVGLAEIADASGLPKSSAFRYLFTLENRRYVEHDPETGEYRLGVAMVALQANHLDRLRATFHTKLEELRDEFGETTNLGVRDGSQIVYLDIVESPMSVRLVAHPGVRDDLHCTALGKAIIASYSREQVSLLTGDVFEARTTNSITNLPDLFAELNRVREVGYAVDDEENEIGGRCVAVKIPGFDAAVSVSAPAARMTNQQIRKVGERLKELVSAI